MSNTVLGIDIGYSHVKCTMMDTGGSILQQFKFPSVIGITKKNPHILDNRIYEFNGHEYSVGEAALHLPSESIVDITEYKNLEYYAPLFLYHALRRLNVKTVSQDGVTGIDAPSVIVSGLSVAQLENSGYFKSALETVEVNNQVLSFPSVFVLPQGSGSKITLDVYGNDFPNQQLSFTGDQTYVGIDVGGNTLDMFMVTDGKTSPSLFEGIENEGIVKICMKIINEIQANHGRKISIQEAREVLDTGVYALRGAKHDLTPFTADAKKSYLTGLLTLIELKYGKILDKCDFISLSGGGAAIFTGTGDNFIRVPNNKPEFYNSIGFAIWGTRQ